MPKFHHEMHCESVEGLVTNSGEIKDEDIVIAPKHLGTLQYQP